MTDKVMKIDEKEIREIELTIVSAMSSLDSILQRIKADRKKNKFETPICKKCKVKMRYVTSDLTWRCKSCGGWII